MPWRKPSGRERAKPAVAPVGHQETQRTSAMYQASVFPRSQLIDSAQYQDRPADAGICRGHCIRKQRRPLQYPLNKNDADAEPDPDSGIAQTENHDGQSSPVRTPLHLRRREQH
jgi:hypothetical protein